jgi:hypothetical protein
MTVTLQRRVAWLALFAFAVAAIAPAVGHFIALSIGANFGEICSVAARESGVKKTAPSPVKEHRDSSDCAFCRLQANTPVLPPSTAAPGAPAAAPERFIHALDAQNFYALLLRSPGLSRAPPSAFLS